MVDVFSCIIVHYLQERISISNWQKISKRLAIRKGQVYTFVRWLMDDDGVKKTIVNVTKIACPSNV